MRYGADEIRPVKVNQRTEMLCSRMAKCGSVQEEHRSTSKCMGEA